MKDSEIALLLKKSGLRATRHRAAVAKAVMNAASPVGAAEIYASLSSGELSMGIATVYRALAALEKAGVVQRQPQVNGNASHYQLPNPERGKVICSRCGKEEEFDLPQELSRLGEVLTSRSDFVDSSQPLYIVADCRHKNNPETCEQ